MSVFKAEKMNLLILPGILLLGGVLRIYNLTHESFWLDEIFSIQFVATRSLFQVITDSFCVDYHPFVYYAVLDVWCSILGCSDFICRLLSVILGILCIVSVYILAKGVFRDERTALLSAFLFSISPTAIRYSQEVRMYVLLLLIWPLFLTCLSISWRTGFTMLNTLLTTLTFSVFAYSHGLAGIFGLTILYLYAGFFAIRSFFLKKKIGAIRALIAMMLATLVFLPWLFRLHSLQSESKKLYVFGMADTFDFLQRLLVLDYHLDKNIVFYISAGLLLTVIASFRWRPLYQKFLLPSLPLLGSIIVIILLQMILTSFKPCYLPRNIVFLLSPLLVFLSFFVVTFFDLACHRSMLRIPRPLAIFIVIIPAITSILISAFFTSDYLRNGIGKEQWREAVETITPKMKQADVALFYAGYMKKCWDHYAVGYECTAQKKGTLPTELHCYKVYETRNREQFRKQVDRALEAFFRTENGHRSLWVIYSHINNPRPVEERLHSARLFTIKSFNFQGILIQQYKKKPAIF